jgi:hypothetical protein
MANTPSPSNGKKNTGKIDSPRDYIAVARGSDLVVIRVVGAGNMLTAPGLADFADEQRKRGYRRFVFDMERCTRLDSTFMGVMVGMSSGRSESGKLKPQSSAEMEAVDPNDAAAELRRTLATGTGDLPTANEDCLLSAVNVSEELRALMAMLGVDKFVKLRGACVLTQLETTILPEKQLPPNDRRRLILKAHETLVEIDKRNEAQFGAFLKSLSAELSKE